jgi:hypothetical protein
MADVVIPNAVIESPFTEPRDSAQAHRGKGMTSRVFDGWQQEAELSALEQCTAKNRTPYRIEPHAEKLGKRLEVLTGADRPGRASPETCAPPVDR